MDTLSLSWPFSQPKLIISKKTYKVFSPLSASFNTTHARSQNILRMTKLVTHYSSSTSNSIFWTLWSICVHVMSSSTYCLRFLLTSSAIFYVSSKLKQVGLEMAKTVITQHSVTSTILTIVFGRSEYMFLTNWRNWAIYNDNSEKDHINKPRT